MHDQADQYAAAWAEFERLERVATHRADWAQWAAGRRQHTLFMVRLDGAARSAVDDVHQRLRGMRGLELHEPHFLHISVQSCGFDDALTVDHDRIAAEVGAQTAFEVHLGGLNAFHSAVFLEVHSGGRLLGLRHALRAALGPALETIDPYPGLLFHLTLGYLSAGADVRTLREAIRLLRTADYGRVRVDRVDLVSVPTDQRVPFPELESISSFALARR